MLVLFAGGVFAILVVAALAFDVGMMLLERRDEQNAADAAALAGARYIFEPDCVETPDPDTTWACTRARAAANEVARLNGFDDGDPVESVTIHIPPAQGRYVAFPNFIEVDIDSERPSIFAGVFGKASWPVSVFATATNDQDLTFEVSMLALDKTACKAIAVSGGGVVEAYANIHSNSSGADCAPGDPVGFSRTGGSTIDVIADDATCRAVGEIHDEGSGDMTCTPSENSFALPDPLEDLPAPAKPALPTQAMVPVGHTNPIPDNCPGATPASKAPSETTPKICRIPASGGPANNAWILYPGLYPGGLEVDKGRIVYLMPGIYWLGGGGLSVKGGASIVTIATEAHGTASLAGSTFGGGVMFYNSKLPAMDGGEFHLNGSGATMKLKAFQAAAGDPLEIYNNIVIYQDRTVTTPITLNGSASTTILEGVIYAPAAQVKLNGNGGTLLVDQIIAGTFDINGNGGTIEVSANSGFDAHIIAAGLVD